MPEQTGKPLSLNDVAPYPTGAMKVTARTMGTHYAAFALMHHTIAFKLLDFDEDREEYMKSSNMALLAYPIAHLFQSLADLGPAGDQAALELSRDLANPPTFGADLRSWLTDVGVDPDEVAKVAAEVARHNREKAAPVTPALSQEHREGLSRILRSALTDYGVGEDRSAHVLADFESRVDGWVGGSYTPPAGDPS